MTQRYRYELSAATDIAPSALAVAAVGLCVGQTPTHALWAAVEAAEGRRLSPSEPAAASFAEADNEAELLRITTLRSVFRHWAADGRSVAEFVESYPVPGFFQLPSVLDTRVEPADLTKRYIDLMRGTLQDGVGMAFHNVSPRSGLVAGTRSPLLWPAVFECFDSAADLAALLLFAEDGPVTRTRFHGRTFQADETREQTFERERSDHRELGTTFAGLMLTRSIAAQHLGELSEHVIDASQRVSFGNGRVGRTAHGFARWSNDFLRRYSEGYRALPFKPTPYLAQAWSRPQYLQFRDLPLLSWVHRPRVVSYLDGDEASLPGAQCAERLHTVLKATIDGPLKGAAPTRIFYDVADDDVSGERRMALATALHAVLPDFDLLDVKKGYDLTWRLGDTGAAGAVAGIALASMAAWEAGGASLVVDARQSDGVTVLAVTPPDAAQRQRFQKRPYDAS